MNGEGSGDTGEDPTGGDPSGVTLSTTAATTGAGESMGEDDDTSTSAGSSTSAAGTGSSTGRGEGSGSSTDGTTGSTGDSSSGSSSLSESSSSSSSTTGDDTGGETTENPGFVGMSTGDSFVLFDIVTQMVVGDPTSLLPEGDYPYDAAITPDGAEAWFVGASGDGVVAVDTATNLIVASATLSVADPYPVDVVFTADGATAYVASRDDASITSFDVAAHTEVMTSPTPDGNDAGKMALNPCTGQIYVVEWFGTSLMTYDPADDSWESVDLGGGSLWDVAVHPDGSTVYVTDRGADVVHVFDVSTTDGLPVSVPDMSVPVGDDPWGIDITSDGGTLVVASEDSAEIHLIETADFSTTVVSTPDASWRDVDINADDTLAFLPSGNISGDDAVFVLDLGANTLDTIAITGASNPNVVAVAPQLSACAG